jgi:hypothetical protein
MRAKREIFLVAICLFVFVAVGVIFFVELMTPVSSAEIRSKFENIDKITVEGTECVVIRQFQSMQLTGISCNWENN